MNIKAMLNLTNAVTVNRVTLSSDGMGGFTSTTASTILSYANIWQPSSNDRLVSDKLTSISTHVLALEYGAYTFTDDDQTVTYGGNTYQIKGHDDNVANRDELVIVGLERLS